ncbi:MAG: ABC transporter ATP-binding protein [Sphingomonadales bacterium]
MEWLVVNQVVKVLNGQRVVNDISFSMQAGHRLGIAGQTGAGKSSLLKMIAGLLQPDQGNLLLGGDRIKGPEEQLLPGHSSIAYLSQHFELLNNYRVEEYLQLTGVLDEASSQRLAALCDIEQVLARKTTQLSGGERQRVALAAALGKNPRLLLLDEPFSNLDGAQKEKIKAVLTNIETSLSVTLLIVSHDAADLLAWADTILLMQQGKIVQQGSPTALYLNPVNNYCASLLGPYTPVSYGWLARLANKPEREDASKTVFLRPEQLKIHLEDPPPQARPATIADVFFRGAFFEAQVYCLGQLVKVSTRINTLQKGQTVYLSVRAWIW